MAKEEGTAKDSGVAASMPTPNRAHRVPKAAVLVAQSIVNEITEYDYPPGHRLPPEQDMLEEFGVARGTLREALRILEHHGVVRVRSGPGGGPVVQDPGARDLASTLALLLQMKKISVSSVLELRTLTEPLLSGLAADRITDDALVRLEENVSAMEVDMADDRRFLAFNLEFHELVAAASGNVLLATIVEALDHILSQKMTLNYSRRAKQAIHDAHVGVLAAIRERNPEAAQLAMANHLEAIEGFWARKAKERVNEGILWQEANY